MKWEDFTLYKESDDNMPSTLQLTDIECPKCGKKIFRRTDIVLTSFPPQYQYECRCGWVGYAYK